MAWMQKKTDPVSERARALTEEISALESQIKEIGAQLQRDKSQPRLRSTAVPQGATLVHSPSPPAPPPAGANEPIFEPVDQKLLNHSRAESDSAPEHFNDLGVRKYDLPALWRRVRSHFHGPSTTNPKLVNYLAAGPGFQGLRPLRYEKRVARNRFIVLVGALFFILLAVLAMFVHHRN